jgi:hypothetical protein
MEIRKLREALQFSREQNMHLLHAIKKGENGNKFNALRKALQTLKSPNSSNTLGKEKDTQILADSYSADSNLLSDQITKLTVKNNKWEERCLALEIELIEKMKAFN